MSESGEGLASLEESVLALEAERREARVAALEARVHELRAKAPERTPRVAGSLKALAAGMIAFIVPLSTVLYGNMERQRLQLETEHEIVKTHLGDVLKADATDPYDLNHLRHLRFLRRLAPAEPGAADDLKEILGAWAEDEYRLKIRQIERASTHLATRINERRVEIARLETDLQIERGWYEDESKRWELEAPPEDEGVRDSIANIRAQITTSFEEKDAHLDAAMAELREWERDWETLTIARGVDDPLAEVLLEPTEYLERICGAAPEPGRVSRSKRLTACTQAGKLHYRRALAALAEDPESPAVDAWLRQANDRFEAACEQKWAEACAHLGDSYRRAHVRAPSRIERLAARPSVEIELFERARALGFPAAYNSLGWYYLEGEGVPQDLVVARNYFDISCKLGVLNGCDSLGTWYARMMALAGAKEAREEARESAQAWFSYACEGGEVRGCVNQINLLRALTPSDFGTPHPSSN